MVQPADCSTKSKAQPAVVTTAGGLSRASVFHLIAVWAIGIAPFAHAQTDASGGWPLAAHIVFSIVAFLLFAQAAVLALAVTWKEGQIRSGQVSSLAQKLPSILMLEHGLFTSIKVGFVTLTLSIFSGMIFIRDISAQHLTHKTVLTLLAWVVFGALLLGRWRFGWRGRSAARWTLTGWALLLLAYVGTRIVLEVILDRQWG